MVKIVNANTFTILNRVATNLNANIYVNVVSRSTVVNGIRETYRFQNKNKNLKRLSDDISSQVQSDGYKTQSTSTPIGYVIQAQKAGIMRDIITDDRAKAYSGRGCSADLVAFHRCRSFGSSPPNRWSLSRG